MALICVATLVFKIPIPGGYAHLGNGFIFLAGALLGGMGGAAAAGIGSALADLLGGWYMWIIPTLIIKSIMGFVIGFISPKVFTVKSLNTAVAVIIGMAEMVLGYVIAGIITMDTLAASLTQLPGLISEGLVGIIIFYLIGCTLERSGAFMSIQNTKKK